MSYATPADLDARALPPDVANTATTTDKQAALDSAYDVINGYLSQSGYVTPIATPGDDAIEVEVAIAAWRLAVAKNLAPEQGERSNLYLRNRDAMKWLEAVNAGRIKPSGAVVDTSGATDSSTIWFGGSSKRGW